MCGITGFLSQYRSMNDMKAMVSQMTQTLFHRGPDDGDVWTNQEDGIALGHRRLSIIDLSPLGHQPMHSACQRYVIVYNGEVYNYKILHAELEAKGYTFKGHSDTEVILALIVEYGIASALTRLSGMFAFALWDKQEKILHLARDRIGEKPLYYGVVNGAFVFGSELKALRAYPHFHNPIARESIVLLLQYGYIPAPYSIYQQIYKLMPGTYLTLSASHIDHLPEAKPYWSTRELSKTHSPSLLTFSDQDVIQHTEGLLQQIVQSRMISDVPIGAFLSGGIDSSLITALMQTQSSQPVKTFTIGFNQKEYNEAHYAKAVAQHLKTDHTELYVDSAQALAVIPNLSHIYDEPFADSSAIPTFLVSQLTRQQVTVCLSGDGGDEIFGGYNRYLFGEKIWRKLSLIPLPLRKILQKGLLSVSPAYWDRLLQFTGYPLAGDKLHKLALLLDAKSPEVFYDYLISQWKMPQTIVRDLSGAVRKKEAIGLKGHYIENMMLTDTLSYLPDDIMVKVDRAGMAVSLETRAPFLDHDLIAYLSQLPFNMKIRNGQTKWLLRQILAKYVPNYLIERKKMGFGIPLDAWLRGPLREWAESLLDKNLLDQQGFFESQPIREKWVEHLSGKRNNQYLLWTVLMFQSWYLATCSK